MKKKVTRRTVIKNPMDIQEDGNHYKDMKIQPAEFVHANKIDALGATAIGYIARHGKKGGKIGGAKDVRKAIHTLQMLLWLEYGESL